MRYQHFKTLAEMVAFAAKTAQASAGKVCAADTGCYPEGVFFRPSVFLTIEGDEDICLRWYAFADQPDIDFIGKRARVEARDSAAWFQHQVQEAINAAVPDLDAVDARAAEAMANPGKGIELFPGCTMLALGGPADADALPGLLASALGETVAPVVATAPRKAFDIHSRHGFHCAASGADIARGELIDARLSEVVDRIASAGFAWSWIDVEPVAIVPAGSELNAAAKDWLAKFEGKDA